MLVHAPRPRPARRCDPRAGQVGVQATRAGCPPGRRRCKPRCAGSGRRRRDRRVRPRGRRVRDTLVRATARGLRCHAPIPILHAGRVGVLLLIVVLVGFARVRRVAVRGLRGPPRLRRLHRRLGPAMEAAR